MSETSLSRLHDIVTPPGVPFWPPAQGWYVVGLLLLALIAVLVWRAFARYRRNGYRREALRVLREIEGEGSIEALPALLKRTALAAWPRHEVASLSGEEWARFLAHTVGQAWQEPRWADSLGRLGFVTRPELGDEERAELLNFAEHWIRRHQVAGG